jgi:uncharacterized protein YggU (UPF0235/DUF167 family)
VKVVVTVKPNSRQEGVILRPDGSLLVRVNAPPVDGRANERVIELLSEHLGKPKSSIRLVRGASAKLKVFDVVG